MKCMVKKGSYLSFWIRILERNTQPKINDGCTNPGNGKKYLYLKSVCLKKLGVTYVSHQKELWKYIWERDREREIEQVNVTRTDVRGKG